MALPQKDPSREYLSAVRAHRATLDRLLDRQGMVPLRRMYDQTQDALERELRRLVKGAGAAPVNPVAAQALLQRFKLAQQKLAVKLAKQLQQVMVDAQVEAVRQMARTLAKQELEFAGAAYVPDFDEPARLNAIVERRSTALAQANAPAWERMAHALGVKASDELTLALVQEEDADEAIGRMRKAADEEFWMGARIIHTATAKAFNSAAADSIDAASAGIPKLQKRWCELVNDFTGEPFDNRVGQDSMVLHGQVVERSGQFVMPPDLRVSPKMWGQTYFCSPNRPNDRSVTMPWRPGMGLPSWMWRGGMRVELPNG